MPLDCRLVIDTPADGPRNMAVDEALLESAADGGPPTLRLYAWSEPTLSLGYFQSHTERASHAPSATLPCVRRSSGGGALVHHHELTYSLAMPPSALVGRDTRSLYCLAHRGVIDAIAASGGDPKRLTLCEPAASPTAGGEAFLCFLRRADADLLTDGPPDGRVNAPGVGGRYKVCGSAQRKRRGALVQHGGVLLRESPFAPELPGLTELDVGDLVERDLAPTLARKLAERIDLRLTPAALTDSEEELAESVRSLKYATQEWTQRR